MKFLRQDNLNLAPFPQSHDSSFLCRHLQIITLVQLSEFPSLKKFDMLVSALRCTEAEQLRRALTQFKAFPTIKHIDIQVSIPIFLQS